MAKWYGGWVGGSGASLDKTVKESLNKEETRWYFKVENAKRTMSWWSSHGVTNKIIACSRTLW